MAKVRINFIGCQGISHKATIEVGDTHSTATVMFSVAVDGQNEGEFSASLKLAVGDDPWSGAIEVSRPAGYTGPWNQVEFAREAAIYCRELYGLTGIVRSPQIQGGGSINMPKSVEFDAEPPSGGSW